ncbi:IgGFc-binding protein-like isoform X2 [Mixophyes fleayi]|uniref:IgGFc-binding protein-like isoform X2 n=1 Tax=Mixophyes fleayi TaxID=3061075 RepID=UPI003F4E3274
MHVATDSSTFLSGKQFVTSFLELYPWGMNNVRFQLVLHGIGCCSLVSVTLPGTNFFQNYTLQQGQSVNLTLPSSAMLSGSSVFNAGVVLINANNSICVISQVWTTNGYESSYVYPVDLLDKQYYIITPTSALPGNAQFAVLSLDTATSVTVTLKGGTVMFQGTSLTSGSTVTFKLSPYQGAQFQLLGSDLSGSFVQADKPVAVLSGHQNFQCYFRYYYAYVFEQLLPISSWGRSFLVPQPSVPLRKDDNIYVVASGNTNVKVYNMSVVVATKSLSQGEVFLQSIGTSALRIDCDHDVMVMFICSGSASYSNTSLKPFMSIVIPITIFETSQVVHAPSGFITTLLVATNSGEMSGLEVDGISFPSNATWDDNAFKAWKYSWVEVTVYTGSHYIQQLLKQEVWAMSYSFSGNWTQTSAIAGNSSFSFNFYGTGTDCSCQTPTQAPGSVMLVTSAISTPFSGLTPGSCRDNISDIYVMMTPLSWWDALRYCRRYYTDLFSIPDRSTQELVASSVSSTGEQGTGLWLGLRRHKVWGYLYWTDGVSTDYMNWGEGEPSHPMTNMCAYMSPGRNFTWNDQCCGTKLNFICY